MAVLEVPNEYAYVIIANVIFTFITLQAMGVQVMSARKKYNVQYPNMYAIPNFHKVNIARMEFISGFENAI